MFWLDKLSELYSHKMCAFMRFLLCHGQQRFLGVELVHRRVSTCGHTSDILKYIDDLSGIDSILCNI